MSKLCSNCSPALVRKSKQSGSNRINANSCDTQRDKNWQIKYMLINLHYWYSVQVNSVAQSCLTLRPHEPQHARPPCLSLAPGVHPNPCPLSRWCHPAISSSVVPFSSCPQSFPASGSLTMSQLFTSGGQRIGVVASASVLPMNTQDWSPLGWTG